MGFFAPRRRRRPAAQSEEPREIPLHKGPMDLPFLFLVLLLTGVGIIMVLSASFASAYAEEGNALFYFVRQGLFAIIGLVFMVLISRMDYQVFRNWAFPVMVVAILLLLAVLIPGVGVVRNNARRWIDLGFTTFQPSELAKVAVILFFSSRIAREKDHMRDFRRGVVPYVGVLVVLGGLMMLEPHLSGTILIFGIGIALLFVGGVQKRWFAVLAVLIAIAGVVVVKVIGYGASRIALWKDPWVDALDKGYQSIQSLYAIGSGGLLGLGLGKSRQKFLYLPEEQNDYIFAIVCEELGFIGACIVMLLFAMLIIRGFWLALHARDRFGSLLIVGVTTQIALQVFLNIGVVTTFLPATGISLPFFSYGGTALVIQLAEMGLVLSVSRQIAGPKSG